MIVDKTPAPKVIHRATGNETRKIKKVISVFSKRMSDRAEQLLIAGELPKWDDSSDDNLLNMRRFLVRSVREGMLERKDLEEEIALMACFVWFNRLEADRKAKILEEWG